MLRWSRIWFSEFVSIRKCIRRVYLRVKAHFKQKYGHLSSSHVTDMKFSFESIFITKYICTIFTIFTFPCWLLDRLSTSKTRLHNSTLKLKLTHRFSNHHQFSINACIHMCNVYYIYISIVCKAFSLTHAHKNTHIHIHTHKQTNIFAYSFRKSTQLFSRFRVMSFLIKQWNTWTHSEKAIELKKRGGKRLVGKN